MRSHQLLQHQQQFKPSSTRLGRPQCLSTAQPTHKTHQGPQLQDHLEALPDLFLTDMHQVNPFHSGTTYLATSQVPIVEKVTMRMMRVEMRRMKPRSIWKRRILLVNLVERAQAAQEHLLKRLESELRLQRRLISDPRTWGAFSVLVPTQVQAPLAEASLIALIKTRPAILSERFPQRRRRIRNLVPAIYLPTSRIHSAAPRSARQQLPQIKHGSWIAQSDLAAQRPTTSRILYRL